MSESEPNDASQSHEKTPCGSENITIFLGKAADGDRDAQEQFCQMVYEQLRDAANMLLWKGQRASYQPSALVNELFVRVFDRQLLKGIENRRYFFTAAADQMKKILIDHYRKKRTQKAGGKHQRVPIDGVLDQVLTNLKTRTKCDLEALEDALNSLAERNPRQAEIVQLRFYGGLTQEQIADLLDVSLSTVEREWRVARAKLYAELREE